MKPQKTFNDLLFYPALHHMCLFSYVTQMFWKGEAGSPGMDVSLSIFNHAAPAILSTVIQNKLQPLAHSLFVTSLTSATDRIFLTFEYT